MKAHGRACPTPAFSHFHTHEFHSVVQADALGGNKRNLNKLKASSSDGFLSFYKFGLCGSSFTFHTLDGLY